jgi:hypothetical protein
LLFGRVYEDSAIESATFPVGSRVVCIASAGCTAFDLSPLRTVTAVDINPVELAYAQRRAAGEPAETGQADRWMTWGRRALRLAGWSRARVEAFLELDDPDEQVDFWFHHLDTRRFRCGVDQVLRPTVLRTVYAAPLLDALPRPFGAVMRRRLLRGWSRHPNRTNPYAHALLRGDPPERVARSVTSPRFVCAEMAEFLESSPPNSFDGFSFSNILDGTAAAYRDRLFRAAQHAGTPGSRVVYRSFAEPSSDFEWNLAATDRSLLWGIVAVVPVHGG